ncbi:MAG: hypothetical protein VKJ46_04890 [Leptolyngbyaceae bacterium]|nr:hypothetical protein [Leptolyngbyaceae bacterium]
MDSLQRARLKAELIGQFQLLEQVHQRLQQRVSLGLTTPSQLESVAYQIHNLYCAAEDLLKIVANSFENSIGAGGQWHQILLLRLSQPVENVRPPFLASETFRLLNILRGFRHFVRHAYGSEIELTQLQVNLNLALELPSRLWQDIQVFLDALQEE